MDEPNALIRWTIDFFAGGYSAIVGAVILAALLTPAALPKLKTRVSPLFKLMLGVISTAFIACGSPPVPDAFAGSFALWIVGFLLSGRFVRRYDSARLSPRGSLGTIWLTLWRLSPVLWLAAFLSVELPSQVWSWKASEVRQVLVIGDSVTAGLNDTDVTWPRRLADESDVELFDASQPGATLQSARKQNQLLLKRPGLVVLEIGGNDLLEGLPSADFEGRLEELLQEVVQPDRAVVMFELPLPPFCARYGAAQRRQSQRYGVKLIPKRMFASVLTRHGATVDGIHLSAAGQIQMKSLVQSLFGSSLRPGAGHYERLERKSADSLPR